MGESLFREYKVRDTGSVTITVESGYGHGVRSKASFVGSGKAVPTKQVNQSKTEITIDSPAGKRLLITSTVYKIGPTKQTSLDYTITGGSEDLHEQRRGKLSNGEDTYLALIEFKSSNDD
jgi:hypothetical protein